MLCDCSVDYVCVEILAFYLLDFQFLCRVADVLSDYLEGLNEDVIKDNFVIVYEVLFCIMFYIQLLF